MRRTLIGAGIGLTAALIALGLGQLSFVERVELQTYDWRMRATADPASARQDIVLVTIDEESLRGLEPLVGRWPWPRLVHAQLLNYLARARPKAVLYDVLFTERDRTRFFVQDQEWTGEESDAELAASIGRVPVVLPGDAVPEAIEGDGPAETAELPSGLGLSPELDAEPRPVFVPPIRPIATAARVVAHNFAAVDADGPWRRYVPFIRHGSLVVPSLSVATVALASGVDGSRIRTDADAAWIGDHRFPLTSVSIRTPEGTRHARRALIRFTGRQPDGQPAYRRLSFYRLFYSEQQLLGGIAPLEPPASLDGAIVIVGATASATYDTFTTPLAGKMGGLEVHAHVVDSLLSGRTMDRAAPGAAIALTLGAGLALGAIGIHLGPWLTALLAAGLAAATTGLTMWQFAAGYWYPLVAPLVALALAAFGDLGYEYFVEGREKRRVKKIFSRYVSKDVYEQLLNNPAAAELGGQRRRMSVLFSDIRGFTTISEQGEPEAIVAQLNEFFSAMVPIVFAHRGTVDKFVGDMIMALYGAPLDDPDHADNAVRTALAMTSELARLNRQWASAGRQPLGIGIGINTGDMVAGNLGSESIMSYTVIGDEVNLGARLESLNRQFGTEVLISEATRDALGGRYDIQALGEVTVKGKSRPVKVFAVVSPDVPARGLTSEADRSDTCGKAPAQPATGKRETS